MAQFKEYLNIRPFYVTKPLIILFTILAILFPWHSFIIFSVIHTNSDLLFPIFGYILIASVCLNFLLIIKKGGIYRTLGTVGYYTSILNFIGYIVYLGVNISLNKFYTSQFSFDFGFYFFISSVGLVIIEFFLKDMQVKKQSIQKKILPNEELLVVEEPTVKDENEQKLKSDKMKKGFKSLSKSVGKIAVEAVGDHISEATGDLIGDSLTELTGNEDLGNLVGKFAEKGLATLSEKAIDIANEKLTQYASSKEQPLGLINSETLDNSTPHQIEPSKIDYKKAILGILKTKRQVQIEYIQSIFKIPREQILGIIYELVGEGMIEGVFNLNDTEFTMKI